MRHLIALLSICILALAACSDENDPISYGLTPPDAVDEDATEVGLPAGDPSVAVQQAVQACREKDAGRLQGFIDAPVTTEEIETMLAGGTDVQLLRHTVSQGEQGVASIEVGLRIQRDDGEETVERTWDLTQGDDGIWRLAELPDCF